MAHRRRAAGSYGLALASVAIATLIRYALDPILGDHIPYATYFLAVTVTALYAGIGPSVAALLVGSLLSTYLFVPPRGTLLAADFPNLLGQLLYVGVGSIIVLLSHQIRAGERRAEGHRRWLRVTLTSIGDGVIATDALGRVTFLNPVAEALTGWADVDAAGRPLGEVFRIIREGARTPAENPVSRVLAEGVVVGLANHTLLVARDGTERPIADSAAPIRDDEGSIIGVVLVFRDDTEVRRAEAVLRESEESYRAMGESFDYGVWKTDAGGRPTYLSPGYLAMLGTTFEEFQEGGWDRFLHPDDAPSVGEAWREACRVGQAWESQFRVAGADGVERTILSRGCPIRCEAGEVVAWVGVHFDITDRHRIEARLEETLAQLRLAMSVARMGTWQFDGATGSVVASESTDAMFGFEPGGVPRSIEQYAARIHPEDRDRLRDETYRAAGEGSDLFIEYRLLRPDGSERWIASRGDSIGGPPGRPARLVGALFDVTDRKRAEQEALAARAAAEAANQAKDRFLAMLSHELRTPLSPVLLAATSALDEPTTPDELRPVFRLIAENVRLQARLIDDLLDITRIMRGKMIYQFEVVDVHDALARALEHCRGDLESRRQSVRLDLLATARHARADPARLQQLFWNLLKNAIKFSPDGGQVVVRSRDEGGRLRVEVVDHGLGIAPEALSKIFDAFEQLGEARLRRSGGLGLGLAISRSIAESHGGTLSASSDGPDLGSTFAMTLPTVPAPTPLPAPAARPSPDGAAPEGPGPAAAICPIRILLVEDDPATAALTERVLRKRGYAVTLARSLAEARQADLGSCGLVISDIGLVDGSGLDLMRWVRDRHLIPGIALTGFGTDGDIERSREAGFVAHLTKPIDFRLLDAAIREHARPPAEAAMDPAAGPG